MVHTTEACFASFVTMGEPRGAVGAFASGSDGVFSLMEGLEIGAPLRRHGL